MVIQIDSLIKLQSWDFTGYTIYLDEFNSLVEYFIDCPTLCDKRITCFYMLKEILINAERVIMTDADIGDNAIRLLNLLNLKDIRYIQNKYKHNNNIEAIELTTDDEVIGELFTRLLNEEPFMVCCDSKNVAEAIHHELGRDPKIGLFTSDTTEEMDLDAWKYVIFSPKIVYGLDSLMKRPVYCVMKEHTISPLGMIQQACRCRNIEFLKYFFSRKSHGTYKYENPEEVMADLNKREKHSITMFKMITNEEDENLYKQLLSNHLYNQDCFNTNKFGHFIHLLKARGFQLDIKREKIKRRFQYIKKKVVEFKIEDLTERFEENENVRDTHYKEWYEGLKEDIDTLDIEESMWNEQYIEKALIEIEGGREGEGYLNVRKETLIQLHNYPKYIENRIKLLGIQPDRVVGYYMGLEDMLIDPMAITRHFLICDLFFKADMVILNKLLKKEEYSCGKGSSPIIKMVFLNKILDMFGIEIITKTLQPDTQEELQNVEINYTENAFLHTKQGDNFFEDKSLIEEYNTIFNNRNKKMKITFRSPEEAQKLIIKMFKNIFGSKIIESRKSTIKTDKGVKSVTYYKLNHEIISLTQNIHEDRNNEIYSKVQY